MFSDMICRSLLFSHTLSLAVFFLRVGGVCQTPRPFGPPNVREAFGGSRPHRGQSHVPILRTSTRTKQLFTLRTNPRCVLGYVVSASSPINVPAFANSEYPPHKDE